MSANALNYVVRKPARYSRGELVSGGEANTALKLAHSKHAWYHAGILVAAGGNPKDVFGGSLTALGACAAYGCAGACYELLRAGHDANETMEYGRTAAHAALSRYVYSTREPGQLACVAALARVGNADLEARDDHGCTVLLNLGGWYSDSPLMTALRLFSELGADFNAKNSRTGRTLLAEFAGFARPPAVMRALVDEHGASPDLVDLRGQTPLMMACQGVDPWMAPEYAQASQAAVELLLSRSSAKTRKCVRYGDGKSAADMLLGNARRFPPAAPGGPPAPPAWIRQAAAELVASGARVQPELHDFARAIGAMPPPAAGGGAEEEETAA